MLMKENLLDGDFKTFGAMYFEDAPTTSRNPTANYICERTHQTVGNVLRTLVHENKPRGHRQARDLVDGALGIA